MLSTAWFVFSITAFTLYAVGDVGMEISWHRILKGNLVSHTFSSFEELTSLTKRRFMESKRVTFFVVINLAGKFMGWFGVIWGGAAIAASTQYGHILNWGINLLGIGIGIFF